jgi:hypothetical protein
VKVCKKLQRVFLLTALSGAAALSAQQPAESRPAADAAPGSPLDSAGPAANLPPLPAAPGGTTTVFGGEIRNVDPVRDQLTLRVFGSSPMKILFDARTQVFRDGSRVPLRTLGPSEHASVETTLDGANIFAVSIHILSALPQGEYQGRVLSYHPGSRELVIASGAAGVPLKLLVSASASIAREGQSWFTAGGSGAGDLYRGTLISVEFAADKDGNAVANRIAVLATPGSAFVFVGEISALDRHAGSMVLVDPRDGKDYRIFFDSKRSPAVAGLHTGEHATVWAEYDGTRYVAQKISAN